MPSSVLGMAGGSGGEILGPCCQEAHVTHPGGTGEEVKESKISFTCGKM